jgi:hypothetical protein
MLCDFWFLWQFCWGFRSSGLCCCDTRLFIPAILKKHGKTTTILTHSRWPESWGWTLLPTLKYQEFERFCIYNLLYTCITALYVEMLGYWFRDSWDFNWKIWEFPFIVVKFTDNLSMLYSYTLQPVWDTVKSLIYYKKKECEHSEFLKYSMMD